MNANPYLLSCLCFKCAFNVGNALDLCSFAFGDKNKMHFWAYFHVNRETLTGGFFFLCRWIFVENLMFVLNNISSKYATYQVRCAVMRLKRQSSIYVNIWRDICLAFQKIAVGFVIRLDKYICGFSLAVDHEAAMYGHVYFLRHIAAFPCHFSELWLSAMRHNAAEATGRVFVIILRYLHAFCENLAEFCHPTWQIYVWLFVGSWRRSCNAVSCNFLSESVLCTHSCRCCKFADIVAYIWFGIPINSTCMRGFPLQMFRLAVRV